MPRLFWTMTRLAVRKEPVRTIGLATLALTVALFAIEVSARAAELVMFEDPACPWCRRWHAEIGPAYPLTAEGQAAPLRSVHVRDQAKAGVSLEQPITSTPTFVLSDEGREIGRIVGYPGSEFFYALLGNLLKRLPESSDGGRARSDSANYAVCCRRPSYDIREIMTDTQEPLDPRGSMQ
jgi:protein-disulfide isomerase